VHIERSKKRGIILLDGEQVVKDGEREFLYMSVSVIHPTLKFDPL